jgi:hypothetical protein
MSQILLDPEVTTTASGPFVSQVGALAEWELLSWANAVSQEELATHDWQSVTSCYRPTTEQSVIIGDLEDGYKVLQPIPIDIEHVDDITFLARFQEANIAIGGVDAQDAYQSLVAEILDTFDALISEERLGPDATAQLHILRTYIVKA